jgi:hypothetical protein
MMMVILRMCICAVQTVRYRLYRMSQEERSIFWELIVSVIIVYILVSCSKQFPRYSYFTVQFQNC